MITIAISTLQKRKKEVVASLTNSNGEVIILLRDSKGNIEYKNLTKGE